MAIILGTAGIDTLVGGTGDDTLTGFGADDNIAGGDGIDTAQFSGWAIDYRIDNYGQYQFVTDNNLGDGNDGVDLVRQVEFLKFGDVIWRVKDRILVSDTQMSAPGTNEVSDFGSTAATAQILGLNTAVSGYMAYYDKDFFTFTLNQAMDVEVSLEEQQGNLAFKLWNDANLNGKLDSGEKYHTDYRGSGANEYTMRSLAAGKWFVEVWGVGGVESGNYKLSLGATESIGNTSATAENYGFKNPGSGFNIDNTIGRFDREDWYKFATTQRTEINANLYFSEGYKSGSLELYRDANANGVAEASEIVQAADTEISVLDAQAGDYWIRAIDNLGRSESNYNLDVGITDAIPAGLQFWIDADDPDSVRNDSSGSILVYDKINEVEVTAPTATRKPILSTASGEKAIDFDGINDVLTAPAQFAGTAPRTLALRYKIDNVAGVAGKIWRLAGQDATTATGSDFSLVARDVTGITSDEYLAGGQSNIYRASAIDAAWKTVIATYDGITAKFYSDGALVASGSRAWNTVSTVFTIGAIRSQAGNFSQYADISVSDVMVFNRAITADEAAALPQYF